MLLEVDTKFNICKKADNDLCIAIKAYGSNTFEFAAQELNKYIGIIYNIELPIVAYENKGDKKAVVLCFESNTNGNAKELDEFTISVKDENLIICGVNERSVLFGVYKFLEEYIGIKWASPDYEHIPIKASTLLSIRNKTYKPDFPKRGLVLENSESLEYVVKLVDWMTKNYYNSIFFTIHLWENYKQVLRNEVGRRGLSLTLGGHNINMFFSSEQYFEKYPEWFSLYEGTRIDTQPCFSNKQGSDTIINNILDYCDSEEIIDTICIWPNDNHYTCKCDLCKKNSFITTYIQFLDKLKAEAGRIGSKINIQHIAYNAQLEWDMLDEIPESNSLDTLLACWGRDYKYDMGNPQNDYDIRFKKVVENWAKSCNDEFKTRLSIFEYYGDYFMLTGLFPPLIKTILKDIDFFKRIGLYEITCLIVPYYFPIKIMQEVFLKKELPENAAQYEVNSESAVLWFNLYALARKTWNCSAGYEEILGDYCKISFGSENSKGAILLETLERSLSGISAYNTRFFRLNFKTVWLRDSWVKNKTVSNRGYPEIKSWNPDEDDIEIPISRVNMCREIMQNFSAFGDVTAEYSYYNGDDKAKNLLNLLGYYDYVVKKITSIFHQSLAQVNIMKSELESAMQNLSCAAKIEENINGWDKQMCEEWLNTVKNANK